MEILGHRGHPTCAPENTLPSVDAALAAGAHGVEVDVRLSADRVALCVHDADLRRVAGLAVLVDRTSFRQLRAVALPGGARIPTLREVAQSVAGRGRLVVDVKPDVRVRSLGRAVLRAVDGVPHDDLVVSSCDPRLLLEVGDRDPVLSTALIATGDLTAAAERAAGLGCRALHAELRALLVSPDAVAACRELGLALRVWTVNRRVDAELLERTGVAAVITDDPVGVRPRPVAVA